jgi:MFS family permease
MTDDPAIEDQRSSQQRETGDSRPGTAIWACIAGNLLLRLGNSATGVLMGLVLASVARERGGVPATAVGLLAASFYVAELLGAPIFGSLSDLRGRRVFMLAGPVCGAIAVQLIGWPSLLMALPLLLFPMAIGRVIEGLSTATTAPTTLSFLSAETAESPPLRGRVMSWYEMATVVGIGLGFVAAGLLWDHQRHGAFLAVTLVYAAAFFAFSLVTDAGGRPATLSRHPGAFADVLRQPRVLRFVPAWICVNTIVGLWFTHSAFQLTGAHREGQFLSGEFTGSSLGASFALFSGAFVLGVFLWGLLIGRRQKTSLMLVTTAGIYVICVALFAINHLGEEDSYLITVLTIVFLLGVVVASGFTPAALAYLADISEEMAEHRGAVMGLYSVMLGLGQLLGGALGGPFAQAGGVDGLILLTAILGSASLLILVLLHQSERAEISAPV